MVNDNFAAITCYFNPCKYANRERGYERFAEGLAKQNVPLWVIEAALPGDDYFIPKSERVLRVRLPENDWLWQKERLLNLLIKQLPDNIDQVAWVDCDIRFCNDDWSALASDALQTWPVVQLFDFVYWLGPNDERMMWEDVADRRASLACIAKHYPNHARNFRMGSPGFAWAARREILEKHGLYENDITGGGDCIIVAAIYGWKDLAQLMWGTPAMIHDSHNYVDAVYQDVRGYVGYVPCEIEHFWHGSYEDRAYVERRRNLITLDFDPFRDLEYDPSTKLLRWTEYANDELRSYVQSYFHSRREDD